MEIGVGSTVGRYTIEGVIGEGGMAVVYLARHSILNTLHALKVLSIRSRQIQERFLREGRLQSQIRHPNIVSVIDIVEDTDASVLVMDYVDGPDLGALIERCRLSDSQVDALARGLLRGMAAAHGQGLIHRDLKPANILIEVDDTVLRPRISDFGLAKHVHRDQPVELTRTGVAMGTPSYMSPEQIRDARDVDARGDVFALGAILYELFAGRLAFGGSHAIDIWTRIMAGDYVPLEQVRPDLSAEIVALIHEALEVEREKRVDDAGKLLERWESASIALASESVGPAALWSGASLAGARALLEERTERIELRRILEEPSAKKTRDTIDGLLQDESLGPRAHSIQDKSNVPTVISGEGVASLLLPPTNLPAPLDRFFGRREELDALAKHLGTGVRLITLLGPGGMGKTRLSQVLGEEVRAHYPGGVWFCDLTETRTEADIVRTVAQALGVLLSEETPEDQLCHALHVRGRTLLILDNMEQVADFAASTVGTWTRKTSQVIFLVTSRVRLGLQAEQLVPLGPLSTVEALQLFEDRAKRLRPDFAINEDNRPVVAQIVERLDGMSLAIELAAGRSSLMSPSQILERLDQRFRLLGSRQRDRTDRQATLRGAIDWSWNLLHSGEQAALAQCSVFRAGFTLEAAERVLDLEAWDGWALDLIQSLVDQSLIRQTETSWGGVRFQIYETIREYARERMAQEGSVLTPGGEGATGADCLGDLRQRHAVFFSELGEGDQIELDLRHGSRQMRHAFLIESENLAASIETCRDLGQVDLLTGSVLAWTAIQLWSGSHTAAMDVLSSLVDRTDLSTADRAALMGQYSTVLSSMGRRSEAKESMVRRVALARASGEAVLLSEALVQQAHYLPKGGSIEEKLSLYQEALELEVRSGSRSREALTLLNIGALYREHGELEETTTRMAKAMAIGQELGSALIVGKAFLLKAMHSMDIGDMESSDSFLQESLRRAREIELTPMISNVLGTIGTFTKNRGELERSIQAHQEAIRHSRAIGSRRDECLLLGNLALVVQLQGDLERAQKLYEQTIVLAEEVEFGLVATMAVGNLGDLLLNQGRFEESRPHLERAIDEMDAAQQNSAGCFRGSLAWAVAQEGDFVQARRLLQDGEPQLRDVWAYELGRLLVRRAQVERLAGDLESAGVALEEARGLAQQLGSGPESDLGQLLAEVDDETESTI